MSKDESSIDNLIASVFKAMKKTSPLNNTNDGEVTPENEALSVGSLPPTDQAARENGKVPLKHEDVSSDRSFLPDSVSKELRKEVGILINSNSLFLAAFVSLNSSFKSGLSDDEKQGLVSLSQNLCNTAATMLKGLKFTQIKVSNPTQEGINVQVITSKKVGE